jgi:hypothetical protein
MFELGNETLSVKTLREGKHPLSRLYRGLTPKTLSRDLTELQNMQLVVIQDGKVKANLNVMGKFTAYNELVRQSDRTELIP